jgi:hypothetical protein
MDMGTDTDTDIDTDTETKTDTDTSPDTHTDTDMHRPLTKKGVEKRLVKNDYRKSLRKIAF